ncbi:glycosyl transferase family protein [Sphingomonas hylomeconis]|uniref:Glycosyl transferase family protein n=1 Tax=Sphingomonas hylomeconis TaxID=1395958 RepID=A0ABV7SQ78_9SPHN|nr:glycosyl transferase family protein [Sphingomonas hylomeconis]
MGGWGDCIAVVDLVVREAMLFATIGFLIGGVDDLAIDLVYLCHRGRRLSGRAAPRTLADFPVAVVPGRIAVFVAAWDEAAVIGAMLRTALARFDHPDYRIYVGCYPNDPATIRQVALVAEHDARVRLVIGGAPGPTTKAACLNTIWRALLRDEVAEGVRTKAVVLHDAEDVVHEGELRIFDALIGVYGVVQLPVLPLVDPRARLISGHYADEFAESHGKTLIVRQALGAGLPLAGVGCAIARECLGRIAQARAGAPFDAISLTEDYELGLRIAALGDTGAFVRVAERAGGAPVAVRAYFPATLEAAMRQKTRWMIGIALAGWDRTGWSRGLDWRDHWMRMRDRRAPLAVLVLLAAYLAATLWLLSAALHGVSGVGIPPVPEPLATLLGVNASLLLWRLGVRALFTGRAYGKRQAAWSVPRMFVGNLIAMVAAQRALIRYVGMLRGRPPCWDKTAHTFPDDVAETLR